MSKTVVWALVGMAIALLLAFSLNALAASTGANLGFSGWFFPVMIGLFVAYIGGNLAGNRRTPKASAEARAKALALTAEPDAALLVVFREGFMGKAAGMNVALDGREFAQLKSPRFTAIRIAPGSHTLRVAFGGLAGPQNNAGEEVFSVAVGQVAVFRATLAMGALKNTIRLEAVGDDLDWVRGRLERMPMTAPDSGQA